MANATYENAYLVFSTDLGDIVFELFTQEAPETVAQLKLMAERDAFVGVNAFRVVPGSVIQFHDIFHRVPAHPPEFLSAFRYLPIENKTGDFVAGSVALARDPDNPNTGHSSISIQLQNHPFLNGQYTLFGRVISGWDVLGEIQKLPRTNEAPNYQVSIQKANYFVNSEAMKKYVPRASRQVVLLPPTETPREIKSQIFSPDSFILLSIAVLTVTLVFIRRRRETLARISLSLLILVGAMFLLGNIPNQDGLDLPTTLKSVGSFGFILFAIWELGKFETPKST